NAGLVKFDFLGLKTLTTIQRAVDMVNRNHPGTNFRIEDIPLDDAATYRLYSIGDTAGVFQVEGAGMRRALVDMKPDRFEDIIALVALYRPGPMENIPTFCARKRGDEDIEYPHPELSKVL
ncbi:MAG: DNA polymerase III subunit alpha, partial [Devosia sp.]